MKRSSQSARTGKSPEDRSDEELMRAYQLGDHEAFDVLYRRHSARVYGFLMSKLRNRELADDLFQAAFLKLHQVRASYDPDFPFLPWLFIVCRSAMIDGLRKKKKENRIEEKLQEHLAPELVGAAIQEVSTGALEAEGMNELSDDQRRALELRYGQNLSFSEIARQIEATPANARQMVSRAVRRLRLLAKKGAEGKNDPEGKKDL